MPRSMAHPYWGTLIVCAQGEMETHERQPGTHIFQYEMCDGCEYDLAVCVTCGTYAECCPCASHHTAECPWPL